MRCWMVNTILDLSMIFLEAEVRPQTRRGVLDFFLYLYKQGLSKKTIDIVLSYRKPNFQEK